MAISAKGADRRKARVRKALKARAFGRPRLSVFRSDKNIYAQIIDDTTGRTLAAASTLDKDVKASVGNGATAEAAAAIGKLIAERGSKAGVAEVIFDRGAYIYHGRVKALADAAREGGLQF
ncbi:large subunit ribosomal protein L18 [Devosia sp. UYZn731]|jgi:large subunit ribosomal protein L18|uniref:50S ribosomal protein L18 n=1 Tax=unclassified Devosia TaxID=196773 RepID=UPI00263382AD|nr:50S ribosomal protein L18 [Devosia sp.]MDB5528627.1 ribosomal protein [Devosia sp.]MDB5585823.1 ribosomal protein [Devosia sp.]